MQKFGKQSKDKIVEKFQLPEYYNSIDTLPMIRWDKINKKGDVTELLVKRVELTELQKIELQKVWLNIHKEYIDTFGFGEHFKDVLNLEMKIARLKLKLIIKNDESIKNFIKADEKRLLELKNKNVGGDIYDAKHAIEKNLGIRISLNECSVTEFYKYLQNLKAK